MLVTRYRLRKIVFLQGVKLQLEDGTMTEMFHSAHVRTGSLSKLNLRNLKGAEAFQGSLITGTSNDASLGDDSVYTKDSDVVIVGMGSFAMENMRSAIEAGAKSVTIVCRRIKVLQISLQQYPRFVRPSADVAMHLLCL